MENKVKKEQRMYQNPVMEILSLSGPKMMISFHIIIASSCLYKGLQISGETSALVILLLFAFGIFVWSLVEYLMHRYVFHFENDSKIANEFHYSLHGYHHEVPHDFKRLFMPPLPAFLILAIFFSCFYLFLNTYTWFFFPGFEIGYLIYALIHYRIHRSVPKSKILYKLWLHHNQHHYHTQDSAFGVSSFFWDKVFRTMPKKSKD
jgi:4-hydroxysphinganine ceramide fatty acyl 2-hydroxylase